MSVMQDVSAEANTCPTDRYSIRPKTLAQFVGKQNLKKNLHTFMQSAKLRSKQLDHVLLSGPPGVGKTTLAQIIANEMQVNITSTSGPLMVQQKDLVAILTNLEKDQILFIDEIHRMNKKIEEVLYGAMEDFKLDILIGNGPSARTMKIDVPPFTLIAATTKVGLLSAPLRGRFGIPLRIDHYEAADLNIIVQLSAKHLNINIDAAAAEQIAIRSQGVPRRANSILKRCHDFAVVAGNETIDYRMVNYALQELKIDQLGLDVLSRRYLDIISSGEPTGLNTISISLSEDKETLENSCEPYLIKIGLVKKTSRGRLITEKGKQYIQDQSII